MKRKGKLQSLQYKTAALKGPPEKQLLRFVKICFPDPRSAPGIPASAPFLSKAVTPTVETRLGHLHSLWKACTSGPPSDPLTILPECSTFHTDD